MQKNIGWHFCKNIVDFFFVNNNNLKNNNF